MADDLVVGAGEDLSEAVLEKAAVGGGGGVVREAVLAGGADPVGTVSEWDEEYAVLEHPVEDGSFGPDDEDFALVAAVRQVAEVGVEARAPALATYNMVVPLPETFLCTRVSAQKGRNVFMVESFGAETPFPDEDGAKRPDQPGDIHPGGVAHAGVGEYRCGKIRDAARVGLVFHVGCIALVCGAGLPVVQVSTVVEGPDEGLLVPEFFAERAFKLRVQGLRRGN